jgi:hypothetical protein
VELGSRRADAPSDERVCAALGARSPRIAVGDEGIGGDASVHMTSHSCLPSLSRRQAGAGTPRDYPEAVRDHRRSASNRWRGARRARQADLTAVVRPRRAVRSGRASIDAVIEQGAFAHRIGTAWHAKLRLRSKIPKVVNPAYNHDLRWISVKSDGLRYVC